MSQAQIGQRSMLRRLEIFFAILLAGCTTIDRQVAGWPQDMKVVTHEEAGFWGVQTKCWPDMPWYWKAAGAFATQCTTVNLDTNQCDIYTITGQVSEHELAHCKGGDHDGMLQAYFDRWKQTKIPPG